MKKSKKSLANSHAQTINLARKTFARKTFLKHNRDDRTRGILFKTNVISIIVSFTMEYPNGSFGFRSLKSQIKRFSEFLEKKAREKEVTNGNS